MARRKDDELYDRLRERSHGARSATIMRLLRLSYTPDEAEMVLTLPRAPIDMRISGGPGPKEPATGASAAEVAKETGKDPEHVAQALHSMWERGLIRRLKGDVIRYYGGGSYAVMQFTDTHRRTWSEDDRKKLGLLVSKHDFEEGGILHQFAWSKVAGAVIRVAERAVANKEELELWESTTEIIKGSITRTVAECWCRVRAKDYNQCEKPVTNCLMFDWHNDQTDCFDRGTIKSATVEECLAAIESSQDAGLVSIAPNTSELIEANYICTCCPDCCHILACTARFNVPVGQAFIRSNFDPVFEVDKCNWCLACVKACPNKATWFHPAHLADDSDKEIKIRLDQCIGCGLCGVACRPGAIKMHKVRSYYPPSVDDPERLERVGWI